MTIRDAGRGTGRLSEDAVKKAAMEAAKRAAEASMKAAAEAAARKQAAEAAKKTITSELQGHTGRLQAGKDADFGDMPWEDAAGAVGTIAATAAAVGGGVATVTQSTAYQAVKDSLSVKKKVDDIQKTVTQLSTALRDTGGSVPGAMAKLNAPKPPSVKPLDSLGKVNSVIRVTGGVQSAFNLANDIQSFKDGVTLKEGTSAAGNALNVLRGVDEGSKLFRGGAGVLGKLAPGISIAASSVDAVKRIQNLSNWGELSTKDKVANVAYLLGDAADIAGTFFPPAKAIGAGLALVGMAAENWDTLSNWGGKAADVTGRVAGAVADSVRDAAADAVDTVKETARNVVDGAKETVGKIASGVKNIFGGL